MRNDKTCLCFTNIVGSKIAFLPVFLIFNVVKYRSSPPYKPKFGSGVNRRFFGKLGDYYTEPLMKIYFSRIPIALNKFGLYPALLFFILYPLYTVVTIPGFIRGFTLKINKIKIDYKEIKV